MPIELKSKQFINSLTERYKKIIIPLGLKTGADARYEEEKSEMIEAVSNFMQSKNKHTFDMVLDEFCDVLWFRCQMDNKLDADSIISNIAEISEALNETGFSYQFSVEDILMHAISKVRSRGLFFKQKIIKEDMEDINMDLNIKRHLKERNIELDENFELLDEGAVAEGVKTAVKKIAEFAAKHGKYVKNIGSKVKAALTSPTGKVALASAGAGAAAGGLIAGGTALARTGKKKKRKSLKEALAITKEDLSVVLAENNISVNDENIEKLVESISNDEIIFMSSSSLNEGLAGNMVDSLLESNNYIVDDENREILESAFSSDKVMFADESFCAKVHLRQDLLY